MANSEHGLQKFNRLFIWNVILIGGQKHEQNIFTKLFPIQYYAVRLILA